VLSLYAGATPRRSSSLSAMPALPLVSGNSWSVAKRHWPRFIFAWVWPFLLYATMIFLSSRGRDADRFLLSCTVTLLITFFVFAYFASLPYWRGHITLGQALLWLAVVPSIILVLLSLLPFRFPMTLTNPTSFNTRFEQFAGRSLDGQC
jgi:hypothetical protein